MSKVDKIIEMMEEWERLPLALVTMLGPWLTPIMPAYFVSVAIHVHLKAPPVVSVIAGVILEVVGIAGISIATRSYMWNKSKLKTDEEAPFPVAVAATGLYFITTMLLTVILEFAPSLAKVAPGLFVLMAGSSGLILVLSYMQKDRERKAVEAKQERSKTSRARRDRGRDNAGTQGADFGALTGTDTRDRAKSILAERPGISGSELGRLLGKDTSLGRRLKRELVPELNGTQEPVTSNDLANGSQEAGE